MIKYIDVTMERPNAGDPITVRCPITNGLLSYEMPETQESTIELVNYETTSPEEAERNTDETSFIFRITFQ